MERTHFSSRLSLAALALVSIIAVAGCVVETGPYHDPYAPVSYASIADLEVGWTIDGDDHPALCDYYGISHWIVQVRGPEARDISVDCRGSVWTTASDLHLISEGNYTITLLAVSMTGYTATERSSSFALYANGYVTHVDFTLSHADFAW